ncbi:MAG: DUF3887 domain-containing protein [Verrucomicrobiota bacterium]|jgi:hypothetical protein
MNQITDNKPVTLLFNPFFYVAGAKALGIGLAAILFAGLVGAISSTHLDGVLDTHTGAPAPLWMFLAEGIIDWLCLAIVLLVLGKVVSKTAFRSLDVLGTQALARWPALLLCLLMMPGAVRRFGAQLIQWIGNPGTAPAINTPDGIVFCFVIVAMIPVFCWMVYLMYKAYSVSCNVKGGIGIGTFMGGLIAGEVLSKLCMALLLAPVLADTASAAPAPAAPQAVESSNTQTNTSPGVLADAGAQFVNLLVKEDFAAAVGRFDSTMTKVFPESKLREAWRDLLNKAGPFKKQIKTRTKEQQGYQIVLVTCQFEQAALDIKGVFDSKMQVAGLFYVPTDTE